MLWSLLLWFVVMVIVVMVIVVMAIVVMVIFVVVVTVLDKLIRKTQQTLTSHSTWKRSNNYMFRFCEIEANSSNKRNDKNRPLTNKYTGTPVDSLSVQLLDSGLLLVVGCGFYLLALACLFVCFFVGLVRLLFDSMFFRLLVYCFLFFLLLFCSLVIVC